MGKVTKLEDIPGGHTAFTFRGGPCKAWLEGASISCCPAAYRTPCLGGHALLKLPLAKRQPFVPKEVMFLLCLKLSELSSALGTSQASVPAYKALRNWSPSTCQPRLSHSSPAWQPHRPIFYSVDLTFPLLPPRLHLSSFLCLECCSLLSTVIL